jgi:hypothetical protein
MTYKRERLARLKELREASLAAMNTFPPGSDGSRAFSAAFAAAYNLGEAITTEMGEHVRYRASTAKWRSPLGSKAAAR